MKDRFLPTAPHFFGGGHLLERAFRRDRTINWRRALSSSAAVRLSAELCGLGDEKKTKKSCLTYCEKSWLIGPGRAAESESERLLAVASSNPHSVHDTS